MVQRESKRNTHRTTHTHSCVCAKQMTHTHAMVIRLLVSSSLPKRQDRGPGAILGRAGPRWYPVAHSHGTHQGNGPFQRKIVQGFSVRFHVCGRVAFWEKKPEGRLPTLEGAPILIHAQIGQQHESPFFWACVGSNNRSAPGLLLWESLAVATLFKSRLALSMRLSPSFGRKIMFPKSMGLHCFAMLSSVPRGG